MTFQSSVYSRLYNEQNKKPYPENLPREVLFKLGKLIDKPEVRSLYYFLAVTGARVGEGLKVTKTDIRIATSMKSGKDRPIALLQTEKRGDGINRTIPLTVISDEVEEAMSKEVMTWHESCGQGRLWNICRQEVWRQFTKRITLGDVANLLGRKPRELFKGQDRELTDFRFFPHFLRACRCFSLYPRFYNELQTMKYFGWKSRRMIDIYSHMTWEDMEL
jgi:hypothetical protein